MVALPPTSAPTVDAIFASYVARERQAPRRGHLGASVIGRECGRQLWYMYRWAARPEWEGRMLRLFGTGHREEPRLVEELRRIGVEVHEADYRGKQWRFGLFGEHFGGSMDGVALGLREAPKTWHLLEFKTANTKTFKKLKKAVLNHSLVAESGGVREVKPEHYAQMQIYMGLAGLKRAAYFVVCKETDAIYMERVHFSRKHFDQLVARAEQVLRATEPLTRVSSDPMKPPCVWCDFRDLCQVSDFDEPRTADVNCRTCVHSSPVLEGEGAPWRCELHDRELPMIAQERGCDEHLFIPPLVPFAEPTDSGDGWVAYRKKNGRVFLNVAASAFPAQDAPHYDSRQLRATPAEAIGDPALEAARETFPEATVTVSKGAA